MIFSGVYLSLMIIQYVAPNERLNHALQPIAVAPNLHLTKVRHEMDAP
jgi:hypothetical protein